MNNFAGCNMDMLGYRSAWRAFVGSFCIAALLLASYWTVVVSRADLAASAGTTASLSRAIALLPDNAGLWKRYGAASGEASAPQALERTVSLNPSDWQAWIQLGSSAEAAGDLTRAVDCYRRAASASRQFQPAWALANYYFRQGSDTEFKVWAARALQMSSGRDPQPLFDLCWRSEASPAFIRQAGAGRPDLLRGYVEYLTARGRLDAAYYVAHQLLLTPGKEDAPALLSLCGRLLESGDASHALEVWNGLSRRRAIPYAPLAPDRSESLTNGDFSEPLSSLGFDWTLVPRQGISAEIFRDPACLRISFSGSQPESCELLMQWLPVEPGRTYRLSYEDRTPGMPPETGIRWTLAGATVSAAPQLAGESWVRQEFGFFSGPDCHLVRLALIYRRDPGTTRVKGSLWLRHIKLN